MFILMTAAVELAKKLAEKTQVVIVKDEDYQKACEIIKEMQPGATIKDYALAKCTDCNFTFYCKMPVEQTNCPKCKP